MALSYQVICLGRQGEMSASLLLVLTSSCFILGIVTSPIVLQPFGILVFLLPVYSLVGCLLTRVPLTPRSLLQHDTEPEKLLLQLLGSSVSTSLNIPNANVVARSDLTFR
jgi:hypothetical protein